jgi:hypothetical protein
LLASPKLLVLLRVVLRAVARVLAPKPPVAETPPADVAVAEAVAAVQNAAVA